MVLISVIHKRKTVRVRRNFDLEYGKHLVEELKYHFDSAYISVNPGDNPPPEGTYTNFPHKVWCPYCMDIRRYKKDYTFNLYKCEVCGMSSEDFWVKKYNHLWVTETSLVKGAGKRANKKARKVLEEKGDKSIDKLTRKKKRRRKRK
ncbi:MAG: hypothetical protein WDA47_07580 [Bacilli bacterium]